MRSQYTAAAALTIHLQRPALYALSSKACLYLRHVETISAGAHIFRCGAVIYRHNSLVSDAADLLMTLATRAAHLLEIRCDRGMQHPNSATGRWPMWYTDGIFYRFIWD